MVKYSFQKKENPDEIEKIIRNGIENFESTTDIRNTLAENNIKIRKQDILKDIRFIKAEYNIIQEKTDTGEIKKTRYLPEPEKISNKQKWMENVFEPLRKENNLNSKQASKIINDRNLTSKELIKYAKIQKNYWEKYKKVF